MGSLFIQDIVPERLTWLCSLSEPLFLEVGLAWKKERYLACRAKLHQFFPRVFADNRACRLRLEEHEISGRARVIFPVEGFCENERKPAQTPQRV